MESKSTEVTKVPEEQVYLEKFRPNYYGDRNCKQVWDYIEEMGLDFFQGNVLKYMYRYKGKNGLEDLEKARNYLDKMISNLKREKDPKGPQCGEP